MNNQFDEIPPEYTAKGKRVVDSALPEKSKEVYDKEYYRFQHWLVTNGVKTINETVLLDYFGGLGKTFSPNSLWTKYSMLKKTLMLNKNVDISNYQKLCEYIKQAFKGYEVKKSKILTREEVLRFIHEAPNDTFLMHKVVLLFGVFGGCRLRELMHMLVSHVVDRGSVILVNVPETNTDKKRVFTIVDEKEMNSLKIIRQYASLRPPNCTEKRFFLNYRQGQCGTQPVGRNTFGKFPSVIAKYLGLKDADKYTGNCFRRTAATLLQDVRASMTMLKPHDGWKNISVAEGYLEDGITSRNDISRILAGATTTSSSYTHEQEFDNIACDSSNSSQAEMVNILDSAAVKIKHEELEESDELLEGNIRIKNYDLKAEYDEPEFEFEGENYIEQMQFENRVMQEELLSSNGNINNAYKNESYENVYKTQHADSNSEVLAQKQYCSIEKNKNQAGLTSETLQSAGDAPNKIQSSEKSVQTDQNQTKDDYFTHLLQHLATDSPPTLKDKVERMFWIEDCISKLTAYKKTLFECYTGIETVNNKETNSERGVFTESASEDKRILKKRKKTDTDPPTISLEVDGKDKDNNDECISAKRSKQKEDSSKDYCDNSTSSERTVEETNDNSDDISIRSEEKSEGEVIAKGPDFQQNILKFKDVQEKIMVLKVVEDHLIAASESGKIYFCSLEDGSYTNILQVTNAPITSMLFCNIDDAMHMLVGSLDTNLRIYCYSTMILSKSISIKDAVQCMEQRWGCVYLGCAAGSLMSYSIEKKDFEFEEKISTSSILALKAAEEGNRRVLIVGTKMRSVIICDATSGQYIRELDSTNSPTVHCLLFENNLVYCGTAFDGILVISFQEGSLAHKYVASEYQGISCMKIMGNLLFASCLDGNIYVYDTNTKTYADTIKGPGGEILSMEVFENQVIVGTTSFEFKSLPIPDYLIRERQLCNK